MNAPCLIDLRFLKIKRLRLATTGHTPDEFHLPRRLLVHAATIDQNLMRRAQSD